MAKRRSAGEGSIYQTSNGRWIACINLGRRPDGRRHRVIRRARTRAEARKLLKKLQEQVCADGGVDPTDRTIADAVAHYVEIVRKPAIQSTGTRNKDRVLSAAIVQQLGQRTTAELSVHEVESFLRDFANGSGNASSRPVSIDYVRRLQYFLVRVLRNEMRLDLLRRNVAELASLPALEATRPDRRALSASEWARLHETADGITRLLVDLCGRHGLRPQEARALTWKAVDFERSELAVVTQFDSDNQFRQPKTRKSLRTLRAHPELIEDLQDWRTKQSWFRSQNTAWIERDLVLTTKNGTAVSQENQRRSLRSVCDRSGLPGITPYELRHTALTHQVEAGYPIAHLADWAGTSEKMIFEHYRHRLIETSPIAPLNY